MADIPGWDAVHPSWLAGWTDADTESLESLHHSRVPEAGMEDVYPAARALLFDQAVMRA